MDKILILFDSRSGEKSGTAFLFEHSCAKFYSIHDNAEMLGYKEKNA